MTPADTRTAIDRYSTHNQCTKWEAELAIMPAELCKVWYQLKDLDAQIDSARKTWQLDYDISKSCCADNVDYWTKQLARDSKEFEELTAEYDQLEAVFELCGFTAPEL